MQSVARQEFDEVGHRSTHEVRMRRFRVTPSIDVGLHHFALFFFLVTREPRAMTFIFADNLEVTIRSAISFATTGYARRRGSMPSAVKIGLLCPQAHDDRRLAGMRLR